MSDKLEALSQPVGYQNKYSGLIHQGTPKDARYYAANPEIYSPSYSQEYVTAILAENAELKASLSEWEDCKHDGATYHDMSGRERCGRCGADL